MQFIHHLLFSLVLYETYHRMDTDIRIPSIQDRNPYLQFLFHHKLTFFNSILIEVIIKYLIIFNIKELLIYLLFII